MTDGQDSCCITVTTVEQFCQKEEKLGILRNQSISFDKQGFLLSYVSGKQNMDEELENEKQTGQRQTHAQPQHLVQGFRPGVQPINVS